MGRSKITIFYELICIKNDNSLSKCIFCCSIENSLNSTKQQDNKNWIKEWTNGDVINV
jgi:hypothetical protein